MDKIQQFITKTFFKISTPYVEIEDKLAFLKQEIHPEITLGLIKQTGLLHLELKVKAKTDVDKIWNRYGIYLKTGSVSLGSTKWDKPQYQVMQQFKSLIDEVNFKFNLWVKSQPRLVEHISNKIKKSNKIIEPLLEPVFIAQTLSDGVSYDDYKMAKLSAKEKAEITFSPVLLSQALKTKEEKEAILNRAREGIIDGVHPDYQPHGYQLEYAIEHSVVSRNINKFSVGLGKTTTALLTAQLALNLGMKRRVVFVVPNSTLAKWKKEAFVGKPKVGVEPVLAESELENTYFVGLGKGKIDDQLIEAYNPQYNKVFMTSETFMRLKMRKENVEKYLHYLEDNDEAFAMILEREEALNKGENKFVKKVQAILTEGAAKSRYQIYFEDLGFDMVIVDELHVYKNCKMPFKARTAKFLSMPEASNLGIDLLVKAWYVRNHNPNEDGVIGLTATPFTNSPIEIYGILSLVLGEKFINDNMGLASIDEFLEAVCRIESMEENSVDGLQKNFNTFLGLSSLNLLRSLILESVTSLEAENVGLLMKLPELIELEQDVPLTPEQFKRFQLYRAAFRTGLKYNQLYKEFVGSLSIPRENLKEVLGYVPDAILQFEQSMPFNSMIRPMADFFNEDVILQGSPFSFMNKMANLLMSNDLEHQGLILYFAPEKEQIIRTFIENYNQSNETEVVRKLPILLEQKDILDFKYSDDDDDNGKIKNLTVHIRAQINSETYKQRQATFARMYSYFESEMQNANSRLIELLEFQIPLDAQYEACIEKNKGFASQIDLPKRHEGQIQVILPTLNFQKQWAFIEQLFNAGFTLDDFHFDLSNKEIQTLNNLATEHQKPRGVANKEQQAEVKQLVFNDLLGSHAKFKLLISKVLNLPLNKIVVVTGQTNNKPEDVQAVQNAFNEIGEDNQYQIVIGNEKVEVGIDLQIGTQAHHHLTTAWTPDSRTQRNGRGARQGNETDQINSYSVYVEGTFDRYKSNLVNNKKNWIDSLFDSTLDVDTVDIEHGLKPEDIDRLLAQMEGNKTLKALEEEIKAKQREKRFQERLRLQHNYLDILIKNAKYVEGDKKRIQASFILQFIQEYTDWNKVNDNLYDLEFVPNKTHNKTRTRLHELLHLLDSQVQCKISMTNSVQNRYFSQVRNLNQLIREYQNSPIRFLIALYTACNPKTHFEIEKFTHFLTNHCEFTLDDDLIKRLEEQNHIKQEQVSVAKQEFCNLSEMNEKLLPAYYAQAAIEGDVEKGVDHYIAAEEYLIAFEEDFDWEELKKEARAIMNNVRNAESWREQFNCISDFFSYMANNNATMIIKKEKGKQLRILSKCQFYEHSRLFTYREHCPQRFHYVFDSEIYNPSRSDKENSRAYHSLCSLQTAPYKRIEIIKKDTDTYLFLQELEGFLASVEFFTAHSFHGGYLPIQFEKLSQILDTHKNNDDFLNKMIVAHRLSKILTPFYLGDRDALLKANGLNDLSYQNCLHLYSAFYDFDQLSQNHYELWSHLEQKTNWKFQPFTLMKSLYDEIKNYKFLDLPLKSGKEEKETSSVELPSEIYERSLPVEINGALKLVPSTKLYNQNQWVKLADKNPRGQHSRSLHARENLRELIPKSIWVAGYWDNVKHWHANKPVSEFMQDTEQGHNCLLDDSYYWLIPLDDLPKVIYKMREDELNNLYFVTRFGYKIQASQAFNQLFK